MSTPTKNGNVLTIVARVIGQSQITGATKLSHDQVVQVYTACESKLGVKDGFEPVSNVVTVDDLLRHFEG